MAGNHAFSPDRHFGQQPINATDSGANNTMKGRMEVSSSHPTTTGATIEHTFMVEQAGVLKFVYLNADVTSDATKTYTLTVANASNSGNSMVAASQLWDADPVLTAGTEVSAVVTATAADLVVAAGDLIEVAVAGGTGAGDAAVRLIFERIAD